MQNKIKFAFASAAGLFLFSAVSVFAAYALPNIGESLGKSMYQIGLVLGIFIGLPILISAFSDAKHEGAGEEGFIPKEVWKYIIPIILIVSILAIFLAPQTDTMGQLVGGIFSGLLMFAIPALLIRFLMGGGSGLKKGFEKRAEHWASGEKGEEGEIDVKNIPEYARTIKEELETVRSAAKKGRGPLGSDLFKEIEEFYGKTHGFAHQLVKANEKELKEKKGTIVSMAEDLNSKANIIDQGIYEKRAQFPADSVEGKNLDALIEALGTVKAKISLIKNISS